MLWHYTLIFLLIGIISAMLAFHRSITDVGSVFWLFVGALGFLVSSWGLLDIDFKWAGSTSVISYTYIPSWEAWVVMFGIGGIGLLMMIIGIVRLPIVLMKENPKVWGEVE